MFDNTGRTALEGFPVLLHLTATSLVRPADLANGLEITDADGTVLPFDLERLTPDEAWLWVRVPQIDPDSSDDSIMLYFAASAPGAPSDPTAVWRDYVAVLHFEDDRAISASVVSTPVGPTRTQGIVAGAHDFDGVDDRIELGAPTVLGGLFVGGATMSAWVQADSFGDFSRGRLLDKGTSDQGDVGYVFAVSGDSGVNGALFVHDFAGARGFWVTSPSGALSLGQWHHLAVTFDAASPANTPTFYVDGAAVGRAIWETPAGNPVPDGNLPVAIGCANTFGNRWFDGRLDEVRIRRTLLTPDWLAAEYANVTTSTFARVTDVEPVTAP